MGLENIESVCLTFLRRTTNPLTPVDLLFEACEKSRLYITREDLLSFLRCHSEVIVVESADNASPVTQSDFNDAGINMGPRAILKSRMPSRAEMMEMMRQQIDHMRFHLRDALEQARADKDDEAIRDLEVAVKRTADLKEKMKQFFEPRRHS